MVCVYPTDTRDDTASISNHLWKHNPKKDTYSINPNQSSIPDRASSSPAKSMSFRIAAGHLTCVYNRLPLSIGQWTNTYINIQSTHSHLWWKELYGNPSIQTAVKRKRQKKAKTGERLPSPQVTCILNDTCENIWQCLPNTYDNAFGCAPVSRGHRIATPKRSNGDAFDLNCSLYLRHHRSDRLRWRRQHINAMRTTFIARALIATGRIMCAYYALSIHEMTIKTNVQSHSSLKSRETGISCYYIQKLCWICLCVARRRFRSNRRGIFCCWWELRRHMWSNCCFRKWERGRERVVNDEINNILMFFEWDAFMWRWTFGTCVMCGVSIAHRSSCVDLLVQLCASCAFNA